MKKNKDQKIVIEEEQNKEAPKDTRTCEEKFNGIDRANMTDSEYIDALEGLLGNAFAEANTCRGLTQRIQADFDNYRKRNNSMAEDMKKLGQSLVIEKLLSVLDNCDLARKYISDQSALTGFNMMEQQILSALSGFGLEEIDAVEKDFDANFMSAVEREKNEAMNGKVIEVLAKGYKLDGKLLRPANVKVGYFEEK